MRLDGLRSLAFLALLGLAVRQERAALELTYLANEGFLVRSGEHKLLIDAFVVEPYSIYAAVPPEIQAELLAGRAPFDGIDLALASHVHPDHFQPGPAAAFLGGHPETELCSSPQVLEKLRAELQGAPALERARELLPEDGGRLAWERDGIRIELLRLPHAGGERTRDVQNLGHRIELGGASLLHVGDADVGAEELARYALAPGSSDVALVPYWWLSDAEGIRRARELTGARTLVAVHVPPGELAEVKRALASLDPAVVLFERAGELRRFTLER